MKKYWKYTDGNARWKYDSPFENWLSNCADVSELMKSLYVGFYRLIDSKFYKNGIKYIDKEIKNFTERGGVSPFSRKKLVRDMVYCLHRFGTMFDEYFLYEFYNKNAFGREEYICDKYRYDYYRMMNKEENIELFDDKGKTYELFKNFYKRDLLAINSASQKDKFISFLEKHESVIIKPLASSGGRNVKIINSETCESKKLFDELINRGPFVAEEVIKQSQEMAQFHPKSLNSVRVPTIVVNGKTEIFAPFVRFGVGDSVVDNGFAGGVFASVDEETGIVISKASNENGCVYIKHPDSGVQILGFQIPQWDSVIELVTELSKIVPENRYTAWDIAHTENGWVMVEGNARGQFLAQIADKKGRKKKLIELIQKGKE